MNPIKSQKHWHCLFQLFIYGLDRHDHPHNNPEGMLGMPYQSCWVSKQFHVPVSPSPDPMHCIFFFQFPQLSAHTCSLNGGMHGHRTLLQTDTVACASACVQTDSELHETHVQYIACVQTDTASCMQVCADSMQTQRVNVRRQLHGTYPLKVRACMVWWNCLYSVYFVLMYATPINNYYHAT